VIWLNWALLRKTWHATTHVYTSSDSLCIYFIPTARSRKDCMQFLQ
jgi:hypothetical protein